ncbi:MAG TPA: LysR family transcriptional regulator [Pseudolabrys sp.]|nr:LysR family transcriptional regulator [Pseudolabrys sp.]
MLYHDLQSLRVFLMACELRSMSKAAERLNIALSAVSRRLNLLEEEAGVTLIKRRPHGIEPTAAGVTMINYAREVLRLGEKLRGNLEEHRSGIQGYIRVCASSSVLMQRLARELSEFVRLNPRLKLDLEERPSISTIDAVLNKQADIGIIVRGVEPEGLTVIDYAGDRLVVALPTGHPLADRDKLRFEDVLGQELIALENGTAVHRLLSSRANAMARSMKVRVQVRSFEVMAMMISQGLGIGILPERTVQPLADAMGLKLVTLAEPWARREYAICVLSPDDLDAPCCRLVDFLTAPERTPSV